MVVIIFNYVDASRKYMGFTLFEIIIGVLCIIFGFIFNFMLSAIIASFSSTFIIRYIDYLLKLTDFYRKIFFIYSDIRALNNKKFNYYAKYYL